MSTAIVNPRARQRPRSGWTRESFYDAIENGVIREDEKVELIGGELTEEGMSDRMAQGEAHVVAVGLVMDSLLALSVPNSHVRVQAALPVGAASNPEPDVCLAPGDRRSFDLMRPQTPLLVVEVSDSTLRYDRTTKASLYASGGVADYWIVNLPGRVVEVYREPAADAGQPFGFRYGSVATLSPDQTISPLAARESAMRVSDLLP